MKFIDNIKLNEKREKIKSIYLLSFLLPLILLISMIISKHVFPFGEKCILRTDFYHQYLPFHAELQNKLKNFESLFYTYKVGLGTNFITLFAYYLASPINILLLLVPEKYIIEYITVALILKISLSSLTFTFYLINKYKTDSFAVLFFAIFYAFSGWTTSYYWDIMWIDNFVLFPLLMYGFEKMQNGKKPFLYIIFLALSMICNYYIGVLTSICLFLYFFFYNIIQENKLKKIFINFIKTGISTIIGMSIAGILLIPIIYAFKTTASSDSNFPKTATEYFSIIEVIARHFPFTKVENGIEYWPNIYCGVMVFALIPMYFLSKKFKIREKICNAIMILFFIATFSINFLDYIMHACKFPNSLPSRYSFIYTFLLLSICMKPFLKIKSIKVQDIIMAFTIPIVFVIIIESNVVNSKIGFQSAYATIIFLFIYFILFLCYKNKKYNKNLILYISIILISFEAFMNMYSTSWTTITKNDYTKNTDDIKKLTANIKSINSDFYRVERAEMKTKDDGAFMHFPSASIFSSSCYASGTNFYKKFGMEASTNAYSTTGSTPFMDALLSIKYKIYEKEEKNADKFNQRLIDKMNNTYLYQNIDTMPFSFVLSNDFLNEYDTSSGNPATVQNNFARTLKTDIILDKIEVNIDGKNVKAKIEESGDYYAFVRDKSIKEVTVIYSKTNETFKNLNRGYFIEVGYLNENDDIEFRNDTNDKELLIELFRFDYDALKKVISKVKSNFDYRMLAFDETYINYNIDSKIDGTCIITLPYDKGFTIKVDDKIVETKSTLDLFLSFDINKGSHNIKITYIPEGMKLGTISTIIGILLLIIIYLLDRKFNFIKENYKFNFKKKYDKNDKKILDNDRKIIDDKNTENDTDIIKIDNTEYKNNDNMER